MPKIKLHDPMKHSIGQDIMFHKMFADAIKYHPVNWITRMRKFFGI